MAPVCYKSLYEWGCACVCVCVQCVCSVCACGMRVCVFVCVYLFLPAGGMLQKMPVYVSDCATGCASVQQFLCMFLTVQQKTPVYVSDCATGCASVQQFLYISDCATEKACVCFRLCNRLCICATVCVCFRLCNRKHLCIFQTVQQKTPVYVSNSATGCASVQQFVFQTVQRVYVSDCATVAPLCFRLCNRCTTVIQTVQPMHHCDSDCATDAPLCFRLWNSLHHCVSDCGTVCTTDAHPACYLQR